MNRHKTAENSRSEGDLGILQKAEMPAFNPLFPD
jgi:hypothetical protein